MLNKKILLASLLISLTFIFTGCGSTDRALDDYQKNMTTFYEQLSSITETINSIDTTSTDATKQLLTSLDELSVIFVDLAEMEVPVQFSAVDSLADEAGSYMTEAVSYYHSAFADGSYDDYSATLAQEDYKRAMTRVKYIGDILMGVMPEGDNVTIIYGNDDVDSASPSDEAGIDDSTTTDTITADDTVIEDTTDDAIEGVEDSTVTE